MKINIIVGYNERIVTEKEVRNAQEALLKNILSKNDKNLIDAIVSHFCCGRKTKWLN